jgi:hypothetical protein
MTLDELREDLEASGYNMSAVLLGPVDPWAGEVWGITNKNGRWLAYYTEGRGLVSIADFSTESEAVEFFKEFAKENLPRVNR